VHSELTFTCSSGISHNKNLAKLGKVYRLLFRVMSI